MERGAMTRVKNALQELASIHKSVYQAAIPGYANNFTRDSLTYGLLADDLDALEAQVAYSAERQGSKIDPITGEEPGKIHHEFPGVKLRGLETTYNACDTTALWLLALTRLAKRGRRHVLDRFPDHIERAVDYISSHLVDSIFYEDPSHCHAERFALKVTYWKDSELNTAEKEPAYPVAYSLIHFQNKAALQELGHMTGLVYLEELASRMTTRGIEEFWSQDHFVIAKQKNGRVIDAPSSDSLHTLLYIEHHEIDDSYSQKITEYSEQLATEGGYLPAIGQHGEAEAEIDEYHIGYLWVHEQALLHAAAKRHRLEHAETVAARIIPILEQGFPELTDPKQSFAHAGNPIQLWSIGAYLYFERLKVDVTLGTQLANLTERAN